ncbi:helix-turn-helix transcriptional regulator [Brucella anthropi]|uniref:helix-turn-helix domain-containing protein n=1 Tax=Brucella anthropi TaxID=529 RepID=UPI000F68300E|nr:helix-turn-helix transcriptional regulator [Brucella anthropi]KAB2764105.1 helix-turn-helix transcriptional regulator [Brucella anthropi]RRY17142.1 XRE family transcriptional regulator [Brucella anthropi]
MFITNAQCRAARGLLNWTQAELARRLSISVVSVRAFEKGGSFSYAFFVAPSSYKSRLPRPLT